jgi:hypothetical protein
MTQVAKATPFRLSRIYAQGWNAARMPWKANSAPVNPYASEPEQSHWQAGFSNAQSDHRRIPK